MYLQLGFIQMSLPKLIKFKGRSTRDKDRGTKRSLKSKVEAHHGIDIKVSLYLYINEKLNILLNQAVDVIIMDLLRMTRKR